MNRLASVAFALTLIPGAALAQSASDRTRDLNSAPPASNRPIPTPPSASPTAAARPASTSPAQTTPASSTRATSTPPAAVSPTSSSPARVAPPVRASTPATVTPAAPAADASAAPPAPPPAPDVPAVTVLNAAARAALPFTVDLPAGFEIVTGRPGPDFRIYTIRRGGTSFAMVYAGPASQFPIYSGQMVEAGGRASVVALEGSERHAVEHLFQRPDAPAGSPKEIHVWTMSLEGADRLLAERIAQSVDAR